MPRPNISHSHIPALDGLRGVAVLMILVLHFSTGVPPLEIELIEGWGLGARGLGLVGVQLFFSLSGFLITSILLVELERTDRLDLRGFWIRRALRLYPALLVLCIAYALLPGPQGRLEDVAMALTYSTNLHPLNRAVDWLSHTWSLSVEEQFYLVWPLALLLGWKADRRRGALACATALIAATLAIRHGGLVGRGALYEILRFDAPLIGCGLALVSWRPSRWLVFAAAALLLYQSAAPFDWRDKAPYFISACACGVVVAGHRHLTFMRWSWLQLVGQISYGLYLWHVLVMRYALHPALTLLLTFGATCLSWVLVERPIMRVSLRRVRSLPEHDLHHVGHVLRT